MYGLDHTHALLMDYIDDQSSQFRHASGLQHVNAHTKLLDQATLLHEKVEGKIANADMAKAGR